MNSKRVLSVLLVCLMGFGVLAIATNAQGSRVSKKDVDNTIFINVNNSNVGIRETDKDELYLEYSLSLIHI